jgi:hypothetical protein
MPDKRSDFALFWTLWGDLSTPEKQAYHVPIIKGVGVPVSGSHAVVILVYPLPAKYKIPASTRDVRLQPESRRHTDTVIESAFSRGC